MAASNQQSAASLAAPQTSSAPPRTTMPPPPIYTFRSGHFTGHSLDQVPRWYLEDLICGGESGLVKRDRLLERELANRGWLPWKVEVGGEGATPRVFYALSRADTSGPRAQAVDQMKRVDREMLEKLRRG